MGSNKQIKKKKSHLKVSKSKKKSSKHTKKKIKKLESENQKQMLSHNTETCLECNSNFHTSLKCPRIWRKYILKEKNIGSNKMVLPIHTIYCYRCGGKGHYGDDCHVYADLKDLVIQESAFSGKNLERPLSNMYYNIILKQREEDENVGSNSTFYKKLNVFPFYRPPYANKRRT